MSPSCLDLIKREISDLTQQELDEVLEQMRERFLVEYRAKWPDGVSFTQEHYVATCVSEYVRL
jgi:hypothetical protein